MNKPKPEERVGLFYLTKTLPLLACALSAAGILLILEVIRPFHDLALDGPLALTLWGIGVALSFTSFFLRGRSIIFSVIGLFVNVIPLIGALILWWLLSHSNFAWH